jgi:two-component sensor histidine kinase/streptogramin lyase
LLSTSPVNRLFEAAPAVEAALGLGAEGFDVTDLVTVGNTTIVASWDAKLATVEHGSQQVKSFALNVPGIKKPTVFTLKVLKDEKVLVSSNRGSFWLDPADGSLDKLEIPNKPSFFDTLTSTHFVDSRGEVWFGFVLFKGLVRYNHQSKSYKHYPFDGKNGNLNFNEITAMTEDHQGNLWVSWQGGGLAKWVRSTDSFVPYYPDLNSPYSFRNNINTLAAAPDGRIWMGTAVYGLYAFHPDSMRFVNYTRRNGLPHDFVNSVAVDCKGKVWVGTKHGLSRLDPATGHIHSYFKQHGLPSNNILRVRPMGTGDCHLFVGAEGGYRMLDPRQFEEAHLLSNGEVIVHHVRINGQNRPFNPSEKMDLEYNENNIEIDFSSLNLLDGYLNEYYYQISENDTIWKPVGQDNILRLAGLQGGKYKVVIKTCTNGGNCFEQEVLRIFIKKPFWKSPFYYGILGLLAALITGIYFKIKMNNIVRIQRLRQKISYDLHDDIGSNLSSIQVLTTLAKNPNVPDEKKAEFADKIKESATQVAESLEEIIWSLHPGNDRFENIQNRLYEIAQEMLEPKGIILHFDMATDFDKLTLGHEQRRELLLLYREALNNVIKYANCTDVWVNLGRQGKQISLTLRDNGNGFEVGTAAIGNGLKTMRFRADNLGGQVFIDSKIGEGTEVRLVF